LEKLNMFNNVNKEQLDRAIQDHWDLQMGTYFSSVHDLGGAVYNLGSTVTDYYWNYAGKVRIGQGEGAALIEKVTRFAREHDRLPAFYIDPETNPAFAEALTQKGFAAEDEEIWMSYTTGRAALPSAPNLEIKQVESEKDFDAFLDVFHESYGMLEPGQSSSPYGDSLKAARKTPPAGVKILHYIGSSGGVPVSVASAYVLPRGVAGIYNVGTPEKFRRNGYAAALSLAAINGALNTGAKQIILQTGLESDAHRLYRKLGFEDAFSAVIWSQK
jgi:GNAT superfamily N-acetyltransferase